eukprot:CAMPEP_0172755282 /NCGR_PEP_ID=MMETSP1074-20121228/159566_1 /TAXON_ID=2916 /ORGANISM="Ceratium fusus, Strain PA161109" /LENGTH=63 /DNA_ID=CAMNT_0013588347 /DNA_START=48 /DNA_END=236 /DNA_ORIENTATION=-
MMATVATPAADPTRGRAHHPVAAQTRAAASHHHRHAATARGQNPHHGVDLPWEEVIARRHAVA